MWRKKLTFWCLLFHCFPIGLNNFFWIYIPEYWHIIIKSKLALFRIINILSLNLFLIYLILVVYPRPGVYDAEKQIFTLTFRGLSFQFPAETGFQPSYAGSRRELGKLQFSPGESPSVSHLAIYSGNSLADCAPPPPPPQPIPTLLCKSVDVIRSVFSVNSIYLELSEKIFNLKYLCQLRSMLSAILINSLKKTFYNWVKNFYLSLLSSIVRAVFHLEKENRVLFAT